jgi:predicted O-methyltransferase YrrM
MSYVLSFRRPTPILGLPNFEGRYYYKNPGVNWSPFIPFFNGPINYLEIGVSDGGNAIHISNSYCNDPNSKIYCVDPWMDYDEYPEYKGQQQKGWLTFNKNIQKSGNFEKFIVKRGLSEDIVPTFENDFFDLIFVDGNHETKYVYEDGKMAFDKVKSGGYIVFDDYYYTWSQTMKGIDMFLDEYASKIKILSKNNDFWQVIIQKL